MALIIVDAVAAEGAAPGTIVDVDPGADDVGHLPWTQLQTELADVHDTTPRALALARSAGSLPRRVRIVGCRPSYVDPGTTLTPSSGSKRS